MLEIYEPGVHYDGYWLVAEPDKPDQGACFRTREDAELFVRAKERQAYDKANDGDFVAMADPASFTPSEDNARGYSGAHTEMLPGELVAKMREALKWHAFTSPIQDNQITVTIPAPQPGVQKNVVDHNGVRLLEIPPQGEDKGRPAGFVVQAGMLVFRKKDGESGVTKRSFGNGRWSVHMTRSNRTVGLHEDEFYISGEASRGILRDPQPDVVIGDK